MVRKIGIIHGSDSDLPQMLGGLTYLQTKEKQGLVKNLWVDCTSQHRHTLLVQRNLKEYHRATSGSRPDILIVGAGWANHLTGCCDAFLRYRLKDKNIVVFGVAFEDENSCRHTDAAELSITEVPGTQVIFKGVGSKGFLRACVAAVEDKDLPNIKVKSAPESHRRDINEATIEAFKRKKESEKMIV